MDTRYLFDDEQIINEQPYFKITLTNYRIIYQDKEYGKMYFCSIMLDQVSAIEIKYKSKPLLFLIGLLLFPIGIILAINMIPPFGFLALTSSLIFCLSFFITKKHVISITSNGTASIVIGTKSKANDKILYFINQIEEAKKQFPKQ